MLSIKEASTFFLGGALLRAKAIESSGQSITLANVAVAAQQNEKLRTTIQALASQSASGIRNTPSHVLTSSKVMTTRRAELETFRAVHAAVVYTLERADKDDPGVRRTLQERYERAFRAIEATPGSTMDRRQLTTSFRDSVIASAKNTTLVVAALKSAETSYLEADANAILARYQTVDRSHEP